MSQIVEEQKTRLIEQEEANQLLEQDTMAFQREHQTEVDGDVLEIRPSSSRVKKVLIWNTKRQEFEMSEEDKRELREAHITKPEEWR